MLHTYSPPCIRRHPKYHKSTLDVLYKTRHVSPKRTCRLIQTCRLILRYFTFSQILRDIALCSQINVEFAKYPKIRRQTFCITERHLPSYTTSDMYHGSAFAVLYKPQNLPSYTGGRVGTTAVLHTPSPPPRGVYEGRTTL